MVLLPSGDLFQLYPSALVTLFLIVLAGALLNFYMERVRTRSLVASAATLGFNPIRVDQLTVPPVQFFETKQERDLPKWMWGDLFTCILQGYTHDFEAYILERGRDTSRAQHATTILQLRCPGLRLPIFELHPASTSRRWINFLRGGYVDIEHAPKFSAAYSLFSPEATVLRGIFHGDVLRYFERLRGSKWHLEGEGDLVIVYEPYRQATPANLGQFVDSAGRFGTGFFKAVQQSKAATNSPLSESSIYNHRA